MVNYNNIRGVYQQIHPREVQVFPEEYFSGADISVYFNDVWVDDITGLSFVVMENCRPQFGYADYTFRRVIRGQRIVNGRFRIAFKDSQYIMKVLKKIQTANSYPGYSTVTPNQLSGNTKDWRNIADEIANNIINQMQLGGSTPIVDYRWSVMGKGMSNNPNDVIELQRVLYELGYLKEQTSITGFFGNKTEYAVKLFQQDYGLAPTGIVDNDTRRKLAELTRLPSYYAPGYYTGIPRGAELPVKSATEDSKQGIENKTLFTFGLPQLADPGFDIVIAYGPIPEDLIRSKVSTRFNYNVAVRVLRHCHITGVAQSLDSSGQPVEEVYEFIASDIEDELS